MNYRTLGKSDLNVSEISFGCMSLDTEQANSEKLLCSAFDGGINYFDTADLYDKGLNEEIVGKALKSVRQDVVLATKVGNQWREDGSGWDWNPTKEYILKAVNESLRRLQTNYIDLYQLHGGTIDDPIDEAIEAFELLKSQGKIREYGISSIRPNVIREWSSRSNIVSVMMQYSILDRRPEEEVLDELNVHDISVVTRGTLAKGLLIDKPAKEYLGYSSEEVKKVQQVLTESDHPINTSIGYVLNHPTIASAVIGIRTDEQLKDLLQTNNFSKDTELFERLSTILEPNRYTQHR